MLSIIPGYVGKKMNGGRKKSFVTYNSKARGNLVASSKYNNLLFFYNICGIYISNYN